MFIHWSSALETGQPFIDAEHRMLLFLFRRMDIAIKTGLPPDTLSNLVSEVRHFVRFHFTSEENLMKETEYPLLAEHTAQHEALLVQLDSVAHKVAVRSEFPEDMLYFLNDWLSEHISKHDQDIARHLRQSGVKPIGEFAYEDYFPSCKSGKDSHDA